MYTIITENDESQWKDDTGVLYHFPKRYLKYLSSGTFVIYYKGKLKNTAFRKERLTDQPHYFGIGKIGKIYPDKNSKKGDLFATICEFKKFKKPVLAKNNNVYIEVIPKNRIVNYWRDGVRPIDNNIYEQILNKLPLGEISEPESSYDLNDNTNDLDNGLESLKEGKAKQRYVTTYERNPRLRKQALAIHGNSCLACGFNFGDTYGEHGEGFIHIHHVEPVSEFKHAKSIDPENDLIPLCANCHSMVHRKKDWTLSLEELKCLLKL